MTAELISGDPNQPRIEAVQLASDIQAVTAAAADQDPGVTDAATRSLFVETDIWGTLAAYADSPEDVALVLHSLNELDQTTDDAEPWTIRVLMNVDGEPFRDCLRQLVTTRNRALFGALERAVDQEPQSRTAEMPLVRFIEDIVGARYGRMSEWRDSGKRTLPSFLQRLKERPYFAQACFEDELAVVTAESSPADQIKEARSAEKRLLLNVLGLGGKQAREVQLAIRDRTRLRDDYGKPLGLEEGGGLELDAWRVTILGYIENYQALGAKRVKQIRHDWGIVNLDRYSEAQLDRMARLSEGDEALLELLRNSEVAVMLTDRFGDQLNAAPHDINGQEDDTDTLLFTEVGEPAGFYLPFVRLTNKFGVRPSKVMIAVHGVTGSAYFGIEGKTKGMGMMFDFGVPDPTESPARAKQKNSIDISVTNVARFFHRYMQPNRRTGERQVQLLICNQARRMKWPKISTAEALAAVATMEDNIAVMGSPFELYYHYEDEDDVRGTIHELPADLPAIMHVYRRISPTALSMTVEPLEQNKRQ